MCAFFLIYGNISFRKFFPSSLAELLISRSVLFDQAVDLFLFCSVSSI